MKTKEQIRTAIREIQEKYFECAVRAYHLEERAAQGSWKRAKARRLLTHFTGGYDSLQTLKKEINYFK